jgi:hypothetical protein
MPERSRKLKSEIGFERVEPISSGSARIALSG